jgi:hypothetical protein
MDNKSRKMTIKKELTNESSRRAARENQKKIHNEGKEEQLKQDETDALNQLEKESQKRSINHSKTDPYNDVKVSIKRKRDSALNETINELVENQDEIDQNDNDHDTAIDVIIRAFFQRVDVVDLPANKQNNKGYA